LDLLDMNLRIDVRGILPTIAVPTVIVHSRRDHLFPVENARYLAAHIPGARLIEVDAGDHAPFFEGTDALHEALRWLVHQSTPIPARFLATVLAVEADARLDSTAVEGPVSRHGGVSTGSERAWWFDGPQRAMRCAHELIATSTVRRHRARVGVHAGEVSHEHGRLHGEGLETARALARTTPSGEVWISGVVADLIPGSPFTFEARDRVRLADGRQVRAFASLPQAQISER
jgi:hypothetical protein